MELHKCYSDDRNCTVKAIRDFFAISFADAYEHCSLHGRQHGAGMTASDFHAAVVAGAERWAPKGKRLRILSVDKVKAAYGVSTVGALAKAMLPHERFLVDTSRHVACYRGGETADWMGTDSRKRIIQIYLLEAS